MVWVLTSDVTGNPHTTSTQRLAVRLLNQIMPTLMSPELICGYILHFLAHTGLNVGNWSLQLLHFLKKYCHLNWFLCFHSKKVNLRIAISCCHAAYQF